MESTMVELLLRSSRFSAQAFASGLWQGLVLIAAVALCLRLFSGVSARLRFWVWSLGFALAAIMPLLQTEKGAVGQVAEAHTLIHVEAGWGVAVAAIWATLTIVRLVQLLKEMIALRRMWSRAKPIAAGEPILAILRETGREPELCTSAEIDSPSVIGFFRPRLLLPETLLAGVTEAELRQVVLHECEHLRRSDDWLNLLQKLGIALFPLNPALLWLDRRLSLERELACDAGVVARTAEPLHYARCLTRLAEHRMGVRGAALVLSAWTRESELAQRVRSLLRPMRPLSPLKAGTSVVLLGVALAGGAVEMARAPRLISFDDSVSAPVVASASAAAGEAASTVGNGLLRAEPVRYREAVEARPVLLKADLPVSQSARSVLSARSARASRSRLAQRSRPLRSVGVHGQSRLGPTSATEPVTGWQRRSRKVTPAASVYAVSFEFPPYYAAVPFANGWLILQL